MAYHFKGWGDKLNALKGRVGELPPGWYWRKPEKKIKAAFLCVSALGEIIDWRESADDALLIVDALYKVQRLYDFALELNNRPLDWDAERV